MRASSYLELNWLAKSDKDILLPPVIFIDIPYGGIWYYPRKKESLFHDKFYPLTRGLIVINDNLSDKETEACLAHEWRHCWQFHQRGKPGLVGMWNLGSLLSYKEQIIEYYSDPLEFDALLFELNKSPCEESKECYEWIIKR